MSVLVEIAEKADVSVEGVLRVLTREPVSDAIQERVLAVLDDLDPEQTRAVQRFALAALHDVLPRPADAPPELAVASQTEADQLAVSRPDAVLVQLSSVLTELAEAVRDLRRETDAERRERVDDLAVLIDLITTGWQGLDNRLGRVERQLSRLEPGVGQTGSRQVAVTRAIGVEPPRSETLRSEPPGVESGVEPEPEELPRTEPTSAEPAPPPDPAPDATSGERDRLPLAAALTMGGVVIGTLAVMQLFSRGPDFTGLVSARETPTVVADRRAASTTGAAATTGARTGPATTRPAPSATRPAATTSSVLGTAATETQPRRTIPKAAPPSAPRTTPATTSATTSETTPAGTAGFSPTRNWAWAPVEGADYYAVDFLRSGTSLYRATPSKAALTLPPSVRFLPGSYRWIVRPGSGARSAKTLGEPVVDSPFTVAG